MIELLTKLHVTAAPLYRCVQSRELPADRARYMTLIKLLDYQLYPQMIFLATIDTDTNSGLGRKIE